MSLVLSVDAAQFEVGALSFQNRMDPAGGLACLEGVCYGRQVYQVNPAGILLDLPYMGVAEKVRFDLAPRPNDFEQVLRILQAAFCARSVRVVMHED